ncbi:MAG TPA: helix-turn-helix transcriptional regulator [Pseudoneobacillus sp.]|nr:helix-turn-helix transcriptional regulator [Pseudoneobacillus sp.]
MEKTIYIGEVLRKLRKERNFSQEEFAFRADLNRKFISGLETGEQQPTYISIYKMAKALEIRPSELIKAIEEKMDSDDQYWLQVE